MTEIQFPMNRQRYFEMGQAALEAGDLAQAAEYFEACYTLKKDFSLNFLLTTTLLEVGDGEKALHYAQEFERHYLQGNDFFSVYLQCLLSANQFLLAHRLVNEKLLTAVGPAVKKFANYKKIIRQRELVFQQLAQEETAALKEKFLAMKEQDYLEQLELAKLSSQLPQEEFLTACRILFLEEKVHYLVKALLLEELANLHLQQKVEILYRNQNKRTVWLKDLHPIATSELFEKLILILETEIGTIDPILESNLLEEIRLGYALLYPFPEEYIQNPRNWVRAYIANYSPEYLGRQTKEEQQELLALSCVQEELKNDLSAFTVH